MAALRDAVLVAVGVGANLSDPALAVRQALRNLQALGVGGLKASSLWCSAPIDSSGPDYVNAVAEFETQLTAPALLGALQQLEHAAGRERPYRNAPRTLDLDLIFYGSAKMHSPSLTVPHPRWRERAFVLRPLAELREVSAEDLAKVADQRIERLEV